MKISLYRQYFTLSILVFGWSAMGFAQEKAPQDNGGITLPLGFTAQVVADNLGRARQIAVKDNGDIYVSLMSPVGLDYVVAMRDTDGDGKMDLFEHFGELDTSCKGLRLHNGFLYVGSYTKVVRFPISEDQLLPTGPFEGVVSGFRTPSGHPGKVFAFDDKGTMFVEVGAPSNACMEQSRTKGSPGKQPCDELEYGAGIWQFDENKLGQVFPQDGERFATGIRNCVATTWDPVKKELYTVQNGRDQLHQFFEQYFDEEASAETPAEEFQLVQKGSNFGWPYAYYDHSKRSRMVMPEYGGDGEKKVAPGTYDDPVMAFPGHWAPISLLFYNSDQFPEDYRGGAFISFHGSWNRAPLPQEGYMVVYVPFDGLIPSGPYEVFADGFKGTEVLQSPGNAKFRPTGLTVGPDGSLYISEDKQGRIWKVTYQGGAKSVETQEPETAEPLAGTSDSQASAASLATLKSYETNCLPCHQADGSGVPGMNPSLIDSKKLSGSDDDHLIRLVLEGSGWVKQSEYQVPMTPFPHLPNEEIAGLVNYVKAQFGGAQPNITAEDVAGVRDRS